MLFRLELGPGVVFLCNAAAMGISEQEMEAMVANHLSPQRTQFIASVANHQASRLATL